MMGAVWQNAAKATSECGQLLEDRLGDQGMPIEKVVLLVRRSNAGKRWLATFAEAPDIVHALDLSFGLQPDADGIVRSFR